MTLLVGGNRPFMSRGILVSAAVLLALASSLPLFGRAAAQERDVARVEALNKQVTRFSREGRYGEAIPAAREALSVREKALGPEHPDVAQSLCDLATLYQDEGRYAEAERLYKR